ncbi:MAG: hypothetical protein R3C02_06415 [Planctomycetaceae bacterium]
MTGRAGERVDGSQVEGQGDDLLHPEGTAAVAVIGDGALTPVSSSKR